MYKRQAIGGAIHHIGNVHKYARKEDVPEHTLFVITTDAVSYTHLDVYKRQMLYILRVGVLNMKTAKR